MKQICLFIIILFSCKMSHAKDYWQQTVNTKISVTLDDKKNFLYAYEEMTYINNSPDTLHYIYMHLWPNGYENDHTAFAKQMDQQGHTQFYYSKPADKGYIDSLQFMIDGESVDYYNTEDMPDIARIDLLTPLLPGHQIKISTPFRVKIPIVFSRLGHTGQAYFISQWFPKPAVYDSKGWHPIPFLNQGEFYSNYGSYDVDITLPKNYIVMATGNCMDESENQWLDSLSVKPLPIDTLYEHSWPASDATIKTLHYHEDRIHDFAWFADKRWVVRKDTVTSPGNGMLVTAYTAFLPWDQVYWKHGTKYLTETIKHYGKWVGPYPYKTIKAVEGDMSAGGGMEYPTVTIIDKSAKSDLQTTIVHEAGHNWFYGMLGTNERDHAWMDEGINTFFEEKTDDSLNKNKVKKKANKLEDQLNNVLYYQAAATHTDQAIDQTSANFTELNYGGDVYFKTAMMMRWLEAYMGEDTFETAMHDYYNTWKYKHPYPEDFRAIFQKHSKRSLDWFFDAILHTDKKIDYTVKHATASTVILKNKSHVTAPACISVYDKDSLLGTFWTLPFDQTTSITLPGNDASWTRIIVSPIVPDSKTDNNEYKRHTLFHKTGIKLAPVLGLNRSYKTKIFIAPSVGFNEYDGFMAGLLFHDLTWPVNRLRYARSIMYATNSNTIVGAGSISYSWYFNNLFKEIWLQADGKSYNYNSIKTPKTLFGRYTKIAPSLNIRFNEHDPLSPVTRTLTFKGYVINEDTFAYKQSPDGKIYTGAKDNQQKIYGLVRYLHKNDRTYNPFNYSLEGQFNSDFVKVNVTGNLRIDYFKKHKALYVRAYAGKFFIVNNNSAALQRYYLNATYSGIDDYLYDGTYFGRSATDGVWAQQISMQEGGFKVPTLNMAGRSDNYLLALNLESDLPFKLPIRLFFDVGTYGGIDQTSTKLLYDGGVAIHISNVFNLYIPIIMSDDFSNYLRNNYSSKEQFGRSISFSVNLRGINWLRLPEKVLKMTTQ